MPDIIVVDQNTGTQRSVSEVEYLESYANRPRWAVMGSPEDRFNRTDVFLRADPTIAPYDPEETRESKPKQRYALDEGADPASVYLNNTYGNYDYREAGVVSNTSGVGMEANRFTVGVALRKDQVPGHVKAMARVLQALAIPIDMFTADMVSRSAVGILDTMDNTEVELLQAYWRSISPAIRYTDDQFDYDPEKEILLTEDIMTWDDVETSERYVASRSAYEEFSRMEVDLAEQQEELAEWEVDRNRYLEQERKASQRIRNAARDEAMRVLGSSGANVAKAEEVARKTSEQISKKITPGRIEAESAAAEQLARAGGWLYANNMPNVAEAIIAAESMPGSNVLTGMPFGPVGAPEDEDMEGGADPGGITMADVNELINTIFGNMNRGRGSGGGPAKPEYRPPDRREVEDQVRGLLAGLIGYVPDGYLQDFTDLFMTDHKRAWDKPSMGLSPRASVMESIRGTREYKKIHALRPEGEDEMGWISQFVQGGIQSGMSANQAEGFGIEMATIAAAPGDIAQAASMRMTSDASRFKGTLLGRVREKANDMYRRVV